uniref:Putative secreted protein n=1 Tax=Anopheles marajoara TaxID=58244 RepID=A0A2M4C806_9DIPT
MLLLLLLLLLLARRQRCEIDVCYSNDAASARPSFHCGHTRPPVSSRFEFRPDRHTKPPPIPPSRRRPEVPEDDANGSMVFRLGSPVGGLDGPWDARRRVIYLYSQHFH